MAASPSAPGHHGHQTWQCVISSCGVSSRTMFTSQPVPKTLPELRERINTAVGNVTRDMLERVWREWEYRLDICRVTRGAYIEYIWGHYETANIPLSNGSNVMYFCSVFVKTGLCKILRQFIHTLYFALLSTILRFWGLHCKVPDSVVRF